MSDAQRRQTLRRIARQLAVEAVQMDAPTELVIQVVTEEVEAMRAVMQDGEQGRLRQQGT
jgi:hypothetical protein